MMKTLGIKHFRLSLSWSRILPNGLNDTVNQNGVAFYQNLLNALINDGIEPWVTLFHWDLPMALYDKTNTSGWLASNISDAFE